MGTSFSSSTSKRSTSNLSKRQQEIRSLGDRYPFGDGELLRLYRCHEYLIKRTRRSEKEGMNESSSKGKTTTSSSFLSEWGIHCLALENQQEQQQQQKSSSFKADEDENYLKGVRMRLGPILQFVEMEILPPGFGDCLERAAFQLLDDGNSTSLERLENFLEGLTQCSRRGSRASLQVLFQCCCSSSSPSSSSSFGATPPPSKVKARDIIELCYRLSLASSYMEAQVMTTMTTTQFGQEQQDQVAVDESAYKPILLDKNNNNSDDEAAALEGLAASLVAFAKNKRHQMNNPYNYHYGGGGMEPATTKIDDNNDMMMIELQDLCEWSEQTAPLLSATLPTLMHHVFFPDKAYPPSRTPFLFPKLKNEKGQSSAFFAQPSSPLLFSFACMSSSLGGAWHRLYTSDSDGLSFNRLMLSLIGYGGPTIIIIRSTNDGGAGGGGMFGAFTASTWKEKKDFYGSSDCFLYQLMPAVHVYRPSGNASNYMYCNSHARSKGYDQQAHGIGFGGTCGEPRLFISESLDDCVASSQDLTFERGPLLPPPRNASNDNYDRVTSTNHKRFDIESMEVWGVGGDDVVEGALDSREQQRQIIAANIRKARKVDKAAFLDDFKSGLISSKAFAHRDEIRGREGGTCSLDDDDDDKK